MDLSDAVAISYTQDSEKYNERVIGFVELLIRE